MISEYDFLGEELDALQKETEGIRLICLYVCMYLCIYLCM